MLKEIPSIGLPRLMVILKREGTIQIIPRQHCTTIDCVLQALDKTWHWAQLGRYIGRSRGRHVR